jgi:diguanylate cyclase (GGDEF)-like protein/PAS domain S-box-containing protein
LRDPVPTINPKKPFAPLPALRWNRIAMVQGPLLHTHFKAAEVVASILIAAIASYSALTLAERIGARHGRDHHLWLLGGGLAMGLGIAAMHFVGMLAMQLPVEVTYESGRTIASVLLAIAASTVALALAGGTSIRAPRLVSGALVFGAAIAGMHYLGMSAIRGPLTMGYHRARVATSVLVAIGAAATALVLAFTLRSDGEVRHSVRRVASVMAMALAISGMHYTGMWAVHFAPAVPGARDTALDLSDIAPTGLAAFVAAVSVVVLAGAIIASRIDQRARRELRETRLTLETRIAERETEAAMATELYALLAEHASDMVSTHTPDGRFAYVSQSWCEFTGVPLTGLLGHLPVEFAHPEDVSLLVANRARGLREAARITTLWRCRRAGAASPGHDHEYTWVETTSRSVREATTGRVQTFICATRDVSERKRMEDQLARSEARFRAALDGSFDAFFVLEALRDEHGRIIDFVYSEINRCGESLMGHSRANIVGCRMTEAFPSSANTHFDRFAMVVDSQRPLEEEMELMTPAGERRWFHHQIIPLGDGVAVTSRDVTDRKQAEEELRALTLVDDLTGLYNRRGFRMLAEQHLRLSKRGGPVTFLVVFDVDFFKDVNDVHGHPEGDAALRRVATVLRTAFRDSDIIARLGGDEFAVFALDCGEICDHLLARYRNALDANNTAAARPYTISISVGAARFDPLAPVSLDDLMAEADADLYEAKRVRAAPRTAA